MWGNLFQFVTMFLFISILSSTQYSVIFARILENIEINENIGAKSVSADVPIIRNSSIDSYAFKEK